MEGDTADDDTAIQLESAFLSTPSGWRATLPYRFGRRICEFLSTPSGWRATAQSFRKSIALRLYFYPRPPGGGRPQYDRAVRLRSYYFYPRPPGGGRLDEIIDININAQNFYPRPPGGGRHGVGEKSDGSYIDFYPRPPGGGRRTMTLSGCSGCYFYPRPPGGGRLATRLYTPSSDRFLSTPSGWRATIACIIKDELSVAISIHALRVEGDKSFK